jgi:hypothetical protein
MLNNLRNLGFEEHEVGIAPGKPPENEAAVWVVVHHQGRWAGLKMGLLPVGDLRAACDAACATWNALPEEDLHLLVEGTRSAAMTEALVRALGDAGIVPPRIALRFAAPKGGRLL